MGNRQSALEWLKKAYHDIRSAQILYDAEHYTDSIGVDLHYAIEKLLKSFLADENKKIPKTHNLPELYEYVNARLLIENEDIRILKHGSAGFLADGVEIIYSFCRNRL